jgi:hypothetical protein
MLHNGYYRKGSVKKISDREAQGAWRKDEMIGGKRKDEMIGGKPPVVKYLWLTLTESWVMAATDSNMQQWSDWQAVFSRQFVR